jgi:hypothetical protein
MTIRKRSQILRQCFTAGRMNNLTPQNAALDTRKITCGDVDKKKATSGKALPEVFGLIGGASRRVAGTEGPRRGSGIGSTFSRSPHARLNMLPLS